MNVDVVVPAAATVAVEPLVEHLAGLPRAVPWDDQHIAVCADLSRALTSDRRARAWPELVTLGYFLRPSALQRLCVRFRSFECDEVVDVPQGLVFHVPPSNVDTIFVYSWALSLLAGNTNVVRLSSRTSPVVDLLCTLLCEVLERHPEARRRVAMVRYGHDDAITAVLSARSDLRVIWGGDATIDAIRRIPLPPHSTELTFADRWSLALLDAATVTRLDDVQFERLTQALFNDTWWFDQRGCSSPRLVAWRGDVETADAAGAQLWPRLATVVRSRDRLPAAATRMSVKSPHTPPRSRAQCSDERCTTPRSTC